MKFIKLTKLGSNVPDKYCELQTFINIDHIVEIYGVMQVWIKLTNNDPILVMQSQQEILQLIKEAEEI